MALSDFHKSTTIEEIKKEHDVLVRDTKTIIVFEQSPYSKSNVIDAILQKNYRDKSLFPRPISASNPDPTIKIAPIPQPPMLTPVLSLKEIRNTMIRSQYEVRADQKAICNIINEYTAADIAHCAAPNLKYFPVLKDSFPWQRIKKRVPLYYSWDLDDQMPGTSLRILRNGMRIFW